jgi:hypothetical protein
MSRTVYYNMILKRPRQPMIEKLMSLLSRSADLMKRF